VTIFFVLSGYLISTLLRIEYAATEKVDYRGFYLRRFLRLMPPLLIIVTLASLLALAALVEPFTRNGLLSVLFYFGNYYVIAHNFHGVPDGMSVVWSLAVEEHYYLLYPPLAALLLRIGRVGTSISVLSLLCFAVLIWRCWLVSHGVSADYIGMATDTRIDAILIGCLLALCCNPWLDAPTTSRPLRDIAFIGGGLALLGCTLFYRDEFFRMTFRYALQSVAIAVLLYFAVARADRLPFRWLNNRVLVYIGGISYTVYLSHHIILELIAKHWPALSWPLAMVFGALLTWAVAEPMRRFVEQPCARLRKRLHKHPTTKNNSMQTLPRTTSSVSVGGSL
jgi:peptidoglycan/LPS O-acetylase OafA/YrhL